MTIALQNFRATSGDNVTITVTVTGASGPVSAVKWSARKLGEAINAVEKTMAAGDISVTSASGIDPLVFEVELAPADTAALEGVFQHESEITDLAGRITTTPIGSVTLTEDVIA